MIIETVRGQDRKRYPAGMPITPAERARARVLAHNLVCRDRMAYREALETMRSYGVRRSLGWLVKIINGYDCGPSCQGSKPAPQPPAAPAEPVAPAVHQRIGGFLTDQVRDG